MLPTEFSLGQLVIVHILFSSRYPSMSQFIFPAQEVASDGKFYSFNYKDAVNVSWVSPANSNYALQLLLWWAQNTTAGKEPGTFAPGAHPLSLSSFILC